MEIKLKMEIIWTFCNISQRPCEEAVAPQGAAAHISGTTDLTSVDLKCLILMWIFAFMFVLLTGMLGDWSTEGCKMYNVYGNLVSFQCDRLADYGLLQVIIKLFLFTMNFQSAKDNFDWTGCGKSLINNEEKVRRCSVSSFTSCYLYRQYYWCPVSFSSNHYLHPWLQVRHNCSVLILYCVISVLSNKIFLDWFMCQKRINIH